MKKQKPERSLLGPVETLRYFGTEDSNLKASEKGRHFVRHVGTTGGPGVLKFFG